jgi:hypothetical protein
MGLDATSLEAAVFAKLRVKTPQLLPDEFRRIVVTNTPREDGTSDYSTQEERGPAEITPEIERALRPLIQSIVEAVVEHIETNADVTGTGVGADWRIT